MRVRLVQTPPARLTRLQSDADAPALHGGYKQSGYGKDMSKYSFDKYTNVKHVMSDITGVAQKEWHSTIFRG
jgi:hypothetical protein